MHSTSYVLPGNKLQEVILSQIQSRGFSCSYTKKTGISWVSNDKAPQTPIASAERERGKLSTKSGTLICEPYSASHRVRPQPTLRSDSIKHRKKRRNTVHSLCAIGLATDGKCAKTTSAVTTHFGAA